MTQVKVSHPVKNDLSESLKVFGFKCTYVSKVNVIAKMYLKYQKYI
jgi:hypothetical protein